MIFRYLYRRLRGCPHAWENAPHVYYIDPQEGYTIVLKTCSLGCGQTLVAYA